MLKRMDIGKTVEDPARPDLLALFEHGDPRRRILLFDSGRRDDVRRHREGGKVRVGLDREIRVRSGNRNGLSERHLERSLFLARRVFPGQADARISLHDLWRNLEPGRHGRVRRPSAACRLGAFMRDRHSDVGVRATVLATARKQHCGGSDRGANEPELPHRVTRRGRRPNSRDGRGIGVPASRKSSLRRTSSIAVRTTRTVSPSRKILPVDRPRRRCSLSSYTKKSLPSPETGTSPSTKKSLRVTKAPNAATPVTNASNSRPTLSFMKTIFFQRRLSRSACSARRSRSEEIEATCRSRFSTDSTSRGATGRP